MGWRSQLPTYLIVTVVAVLIWLWAAGETRETDERTFHVQFTTQFPADHIVTPKETTITVEIEGSRSALRSAPAMGSPIVLRLDAGLGDHAVDLVRLLNDHPDLRDARVSVISTDPPSQEVTIDKLVLATVRVEDPDLGRLQTDGAILIDPPQVTVRLPQRLQDRLGAGVSVKALVDPAQLGRLNPGEPARLTARVELPESLATQESVTVTPTAVTVSFTVRSNIKEVTLPTIPVHISGPWKDHEEYIVEVAEADQFLENVTVTADAALIDRIESSEVKVFAFVHISSTEKEQGIESKPVTYFLALLPEGGASIVAAQLNGSSQPPLIHLHISERAGPP
ncbi:MAG: hypothetical protein IIA64_01380 [Planctomycetes bacterium]|nr:hypothetical protein [Planctomycetota bacterium]